jgi:molybdopterin synthase sulfur carrier subunit
MADYPSTVCVRMFGALGAAAQGKEIHVEATRLDDLLTRLADIYGGEFDRILSMSSVLVDGVHQEVAPLALRPGAQVDLLPPFAGG